MADNIYTLTGYSLTDPVADVNEQLKNLSGQIPDCGRVIFFVGAGLSVTAGYPLWTTAADRALTLARECGAVSRGAAAYIEEKLKKQQYYDVFEILKRELAEPTFYRIAIEVFGENLPPSEIHQLLVKIPCHGIITTNFDECISAAYAMEHGTLPINEIRVALASDKFFVVKPHGSVLNPKSMVLTIGDWQRVVADGDLKELLAQAVSSYQLIFLGYGFRDPDFEGAWEKLLVERIFRLPAVYCTQAGLLPPSRVEEFRKKNVQVLEFEDDGSFGFVPAILRHLHSLCTSKRIVAPSPPPSAPATELEKYVLLCLQFSPPEKSRLVLVAKAIILETLSKLQRGTVHVDSFLEHVVRLLGQDSAIIRDSSRIALRQLEATGVIARRGDEFEAQADKIRTIGDQAAEMEAAESSWAGKALREQAGILGLQVESDDHARMLQVLDRVLLEVGRDLAELFLFNRPPRDESARIDETVEQFLGASEGAKRRELYSRAARRLLLEPTEDEEDLLFKRLQAYFISSAYLLNPTSERLLAEYAREHKVYFDSSIFLPALALGHPSNAVFRQLLRRTKALGMRLMIIADMLDEVWANVRTATSAFNDFKRMPTSLEDAVGAYVAMNGTGRGNVFLEGFLNQMQLDPTLTPETYMATVLGSNELPMSTEQTLKAVQEAFGAELDGLKEDEVDGKVLESIVDSIEHLRKHGGRYKTRLLCEHEARQFYLIHLRRKQNPEMSAKIWYVTTDRFVAELQRLERERFPLPVSYTPRSWFQYLDLVDFDSRGSRHFSRLHPALRFGVVSGEFGMEAIRIIVAQQRDLLQKGVVTLKELSQAVVTHFHVKQAMSEADLKLPQDRTEETAQSERKERLTNAIAQATKQFVAVKSEELENLKAEARREREEREKLEKKLAKEKHTSRTLKGALRSRKRRKKPRH